MSTYILRSYTICYFPFFNHDYYVVLATMITFSYLTWLSVSLGNMIPVFVTIVTKCITWLHGYWLSEIVIFKRYYRFIYQIYLIWVLQYYFFCWWNLCDLCKVFFLSFVHLIWNKVCNKTTISSTKIFLIINRNHIDVADWQNEDILTILLFINSL